MRSLLALVVLVLTCTPDAPHVDDPTTDPARMRSIELPPMPGPAAAAPPTLPLRRLAVHGSREHEAPWTSRVHDHYGVDSDELTQLLSPPPELWPTTGPAAPLLDALCLGAVDCDDPDVDTEALVRPVLEAAEEAGLLDAPAGTVGDSWDRYVSLWITFLESGGFFMDEEVAAELDRGVLRTLEQTPDGPLRGPLLMAALLIGELDDDVKTDMMWELLDEHEGTLAVIAMDGLAERGVPASAFDAFDFEGEPELELFRLRFHLENAHASGNADRIRAAAAALGGHPDAEHDDLLDVQESSFALQAEGPETPWERALADELLQCADVVPGAVVHFTVVADRWTVSGDDPAADCLHGWSWPEPVDDQRVELRLLR